MVKLRQPKVRPKSKPLWVLGAVCAGVIFGCLLMIATHPDDMGCVTRTKSVPSPGDVFLAEKHTRFCGLGWAGSKSRRVDVALSKSGEDGWAFTLPLLFETNDADKRPPSPTLQWIDGTNLDVKVYSNDAEGILVRHQGDLTVTVRYLPPEPS